MPLQIEPGSGPRVLLVDDDPVSRVALERATHAAIPRAELSVVGSATDACGLLSRLRFELIITDLCMKRMSGREFIRALRSSRFLCDAPVVVVTADRQGTLDRHADLNRVFYLRKPVPWDELVEMLRQCLRTGSLEGEHEQRQSRANPAVVVDELALGLNLGDDPLVQSGVLEAFLHKTVERRCYLRNIGGGVFSYSQARVELHGMMGAAAIVGAGRLAAALDALMQAVVEDDVYMVRLLATEADQQLLAAHSALLEKLGDLLERT